MRRPLAAVWMITLCSMACGDRPPEADERNAPLTFPPGLGPSPANIVAAAIDWSMPSIFGRDFDGDGLPDLIPIKTIPAGTSDWPVEGSLLRPTGWKVTLDGCGSAALRGAIVGYAWDISLPTGLVHVDAGSSCRHTFTFPGQGTFKVSLTARAADGFQGTATRDVLVKNHLIVSIGDSIASGEGNPDVPGVRGLPARPPVWSDQRCHRSQWSGPAQAALQLEQSDPHTSVRFISVACSGAEIDEGLIGPYLGIEPNFNRPPGGPLQVPPLPPQVDQVADIVCGLRGTPPGAPGPGPCASIDALLISVGANDVGFGGIVYDCAAGDCPNGWMELNLQQAMLALPDKFSRLRDYINARLTFRHTYITEYQDPVRNDAGDVCQQILFEDAALGFIDGDISKSEATWAIDKLVVPLNKKVRDEASELRWTFVDDIASEFKTHGYCASNPYVVRFEQSWRDQFTNQGVLHPNRAGHQVYARRIFESLQGLARPLTSTVSWSTDRLDTFARGTDDGLYHNWSDAAGRNSWGGWHGLGGDLAGAPAAVSWGPNRLDVVARFRNGGIQHMAWDGNAGGWTGWTDLRGAMRSDPELVSWGPDHLGIFARGQDGMLWERSHYPEPTGWDLWRPIGGPPFLGSPSAVSWGKGRVDVFVRGVDAAIHHGWRQDFAAWQWESLGGAGTSSPKAVSWSEGRIDLFVRGTDAALYHQWFNGSGWGAWEPLGGPFASDPEAVSVGPNRLDVFLRDGSRMVRYLSWNNGWSAWKSIDQVSSGVDAVARKNGQIEVMARRPNDLAVEQFASGAGWEAYSLGGAVR